MKLEEIGFTPPFRLQPGIVQHATGKTEDPDRAMPLLANVSAAFGPPWTRIVFSRAILIEGALLPEEEFLLNTKVNAAGENARSCDLSDLIAAKTVFEGLDWKKIILSTGLPC